MWKTLNSQLVYEDKWIKLYKDSIQFNNNETGEYTYLKRHDGAHVVIITPENKLLLIKQYRYPIHNLEWSLPGGKIDQEEKPIDAAIREVKEETGIHLSKIIPLGIWIAQSSLNTEKLYYFVGWASNVPTANGNSDEVIAKVETFSSKTILTMIDSGEITDPSASNALQITIRKYLSTEL